MAAAVEQEGSDLMLVTERIVRTVRRELDVEPLIVADFDLSRIDLSSRKQVRDTNEAPKDQVDQYTWMMDEGDVFPPILVCDDPAADDDPVLNDGNTRTRAHRNRGERFASAIVIPINYHTADPETRARIDYIAGSLNAKNGRPNSKSERDMLIRNGIEAGKPDKEIATTAGVSVQTVTNMRDRVLAVKRLRDTEGLEREDLPHLKDTAVSRLNKADDLPDDLFVETAKLANAAAMNAGDVTTLVNQLRKAGTPEAAREKLENEREQWKPRISEVARGNGGGAQKPLSGQLRRSLGFVIKNAATAYVERNADHAQDHEELVSQSIERLQEVLKLQQEFNADLRSRLATAMQEDDAA